MSNLLPHNHRRLVHRFAMLKILTVICGAGLVLMILGAVLFTPTLITINSRYGLAQNQVVLLEKSGAIASPVDIASFDARTNTLVHKLASPITLAPTEYIETVQKIAPTGVILDGYTLSQGDTPGITLHGTVSTRETLQGYITTLQALPQVNMVDSPISNYVVGKNSEFTITITFK